MTYVTYDWVKYKDQYTSLMDWMSLMGYRQMDTHSFMKAWQIPAAEEDGKICLPYLSINQILFV